VARTVGIKREYLATRCDIKGRFAVGGRAANCLKSWRKLLEATTGIEPVCTDLQSIRQGNLIKQLVANRAQYRALGINHLRIICKPLG